MQTVFIDIGVNLTDAAFASDHEQVIYRARNVGVQSVIVIGTDLPHSRQAVQLCEQQPEFLYCTAGVHPHYASQWNDEHEQALRDLTRHSRVVAIGETGLDFNRNLSPPDVQKTAFEKHLMLAADTGLPLYLHERDALEDQIALLKKYRQFVAGGVAHCFTGTEQALQDYLALDLYIGITGWICDERRGTHLRELVRHIPQDRLLLETDAPYLLPRDLTPKPKSRRNEPCHLPHIASTVASCLAMPVDELAAITTANAKALFGLP